MSLAFSATKISGKTEKRFTYQRSQLLRLNTGDIRWIKYEYVMILTGWNRRTRRIKSLTPNLGTIWKWLVNFTLLPLYPREKTTVPIPYEVRFVPEYMWTFGEKYHGATEIRSPVLSARSLVAIQTTPRRIMWSIRHSYSCVVNTINKPRKTLSTI